MYNHVDLEINYQKKISIVETLKPLVRLGGLCKNYVDVQIARRADTVQILCTCFP